MGNFLRSLHFEGPIKQGVSPPGVVLTRWHSLGPSLTSFQRPRSSSCPKPLSAARRTGPRTCSGFRGIACVGHIDRRTQEGIFAAPCASVRLSPSTRERLRCVQHSGHIGEGPHPASLAGAYACSARGRGGRGDGIGTEEPDLASGGEDCSSRAEGHGLIERLARDGAIILGRVEHPIGMAKYQMRCLDPARHAAAGMRLAAWRRDGAGTSTDQRSERRVNPRSAAGAARARSRKCPAHPATSLSVTRVRAHRIGYCRPHRRRRPEKTSVLPG